MKWYRIAKDGDFEERQFNGDQEAINYALSREARVFIWANGWREYTEYWTKANAYLAQHDRR